MSLRWAAACALSPDGRVPVRDWQNARGVPYSTRIADLVCRRKLRKSFIALPFRHTVASELGSVCRDLAGQGAKALFLRLREMSGDRSRTLSWLSVAEIWSCPTALVRSVASVNAVSSP